MICHYEVDLLFVPYFGKFNDPRTDMVGQGVRVSRRLGRYRRWSIRVSSLTLAHVTRLALSEGWEISDLMRTMVILAAAVAWFGLDNEKKLDASREIATLDRLRKALGMLTPGVVQKRPYGADRAGQDTDVVTLILPAGVAELIESFAAAKMMTKNDLCGVLLTEGLILYMSAEQRLLVALQNRTRETPSVAT